MSFALLLPLGLLALTAWALPLLLHLARREQQQPTDFAALRWLAAKLKPRQRLRFEEWLLLAVRLLLIAALALLLAMPVWTGGGDTQAFVVVHPALNAPAGETDTTHQSRWLAPGFPPLTAPRPALPVATASLLRQLDAELPAGTALTVQVPAWFDGADGARLQLSRDVDWQVLPTPLPADVVAVAAAVPVLVVRHDDAHAAQVRWLRAAAAAWAARAASGEQRAASAEAVDIDVADTAAALPGHDHIVAWLAAGELPAPLRDWIAAGGTALLADDATWPLEQPGAVAWRDADGSALASAATLGRGRVVRLQQPLRPALLPALLEADFPARLRALLQPPAPPPTRADAATQAPRAGAAAFAAIPQPADSLLIVVVLLLFALERGLASGRRPEPGA
jgi:hypothetical protein